MIFEKDSVYHHIIVAENRLARYLRFDRSFQSAMYLNDPFESPILYPEYFHLGFVFAPNAKRILMVGLGAGTAAKQFWRDYPGATVEIAELDPMVKEVARRFFSLPQDPRLQITVQDGRAFLRKHQERYDMIVLDAYFADSIPFHLTTREFLELARARLTPGGVVVSNIYGALRGPSSNLFRAMYRTFSSVFPGLYVFPTGFSPYGDAEATRNIILIASPGRSMPRDQILNLARRLSQRNGRAALVRYAAEYYDTPIETGDVPLLTDDYAPVDALLPIYWRSPVPP